MRIVTLPTAVLLAGCAAGFAHGKPETLYTTIPQTQPYVEIGSLQASALVYSASADTAREEAMLRLHAKAIALGADAVVGVEASGKCGLTWLWAIAVVIPNCSTKATGLAVRWGVMAVEETASDETE